ncbi:hypothetical protein BT67DRAFT_443468 [Trichocladium antarcticum]|uniref:Uncharacterized protein n=1 Tax=Trichocladium antarcticum TaxID=1450529 RepID=A0AAN6UH91_9PEZI|nr:hypothetical protein BT67DRAFT_443468 [Trichocladium antarcticum]
MWPTPCDSGQAPSDDSWLLVSPSSTASEAEPPYVLSTDPYCFVSRANDGIADPYYFITHRSSASVPRGSNTASSDTRRHPSLSTTAQPAHPANSGQRPDTAPRPGHSPRHNSPRQEHSPPRATVPSPHYVPRHRRGDASTSSGSSNLTTNTDRSLARTATTTDQPSHALSSLNTTWGSRSNSDPNPDPRPQPRPEALPPIWSPRLNFPDDTGARPRPSDASPGGTEPQRRREVSSSRRRADDHLAGAGFSVAGVRRVSEFYEGLRRERDAAEWDGDPIEPEREGGRLAPRSRREDIDLVLGREMARYGRGSG